MRRKNKNRNKENNKNSYARDPNNKSIRKSIIIACEDSVSSPTYFSELFKELKDNKKITPFSLIIAKHQHTNPTGVLQDLKNQNGYKDFDYKWIVIDRDKENNSGAGHSAEDFKKAIQQAKKENIDVAYSNDCFEIWYLLHFDYIDTSINREDLIQKVIKKLQYLNPELFNLNTRNIKNKEYAIKIYQHLKEKQNTAIKNSQKLLNSYNPKKPEQDNPSTTIHKLVKLLNGLQK